MSLDLGKAKIRSFRLGIFRNEMMKNLPILCIYTILSVSTIVHAQVTKSKGDVEYERFNFNEAIRQYEREIKKKKNDIHLQLKLAVCYMKMHDEQEAERVFQQIDESKFTPEAKLHFAQVLFQNGQYNEAKKWYLKASIANANDFRIKNILERFDLIDQLYADSALFKIYYLEFNSPQPEFAPIAYSNGVVFTSGRFENKNVIGNRIYSRDNGSFLDLFFIDTLNLIKTEFNTPHRYKSTPKDLLDRVRDSQNQMHDDETSITSNDSETLGYFKDVQRGIRVLKLPDRINSKLHESSATFTKDERTIYFTRSDYDVSMNGAKQSKIAYPKIYSATKNENGEWDKVKVFPYCSSNYSVAHPALANDDQTIYFTSDMPGGVGGTDIYKSSFINGNWSEPKNLGRPINTEGNEMFPFVSSSNQLYFSSDGHFGLGGLDIFKYDLINDDHNQPKNLGFPINSRNDDFSLITNRDGSKGYFSSNRKNGGLDDDLYLFTAKKEQASKGDLVLFAFSTIKLDTLTNVVFKIYESDNKLSPLSSDKKGNAQLYHVKQGAIYTIEATHGTTNVSLTLPPFPDERKVTLGIPLDDLNYKNALEQIRNHLDSANHHSQNNDSERRNKKRIDCSWFKENFISEVFYDFDKSELSNAALPSLFKAIELLDRNNDLTIKLVSHTDSRGLSNYNLSLSKNRSEAVSNWLLSHDVDKKRFTSDYAGETQLVNGCKDGTYCNEFEHKLNRRTVFNLIKNSVNLNIHCAAQPVLIAKTNIIYFDQNTSNISGDAVSTLEILINRLKSNLSMRIDVFAHGDSNATDKDNEKLAKERLESVIQYLIKHGASPTQFNSLQHFGEKRIIRSRPNQHDSHPTTSSVEFFIVNE
jgi:outer membrane protein OmpA-like peptidoglycan-associated protein